MNYEASRYNKFLSTRLTLHGLSSTRVTPAMEAGVTDRLWSLEDIVGIVDEWEANQKEGKHAS